MQMFQRYLRNAWNAQYRYFSRDATKIADNFQIFGIHNIASAQLGVRMLGFSEQRSVI